MTAKKEKEGPVLGTGATGDPNNPGVKHSDSYDKTTDELVDPVPVKSTGPGVKSESKETSK